MSLSPISNRPTFRPSPEIQKPNPTVTPEKNLGSAPSAQAPNKDHQLHQTDTFDKKLVNQPAKDLKTDGLHKVKDTLRDAVKTDGLHKVKDATKDLKTRFNKDQVEKADKHVERQQVARHFETQEAAKMLAQLQNAQQAAQPMVRDLAA